jgi:hypothetical protein
VISRTGEKLPLYTGLYYGVINKKSGYTWADHHNLVRPLDPRNPSHWHKLEKTSMGLNAYHMGKMAYYSYIEKVNQNYYRIVEIGKYTMIIENVNTNLTFKMNFLVVKKGNTCSGKPITDGRYLEGRHSKALCCTNCQNTCQNTFADEFQWTFTEMPDYKLNAIMTDFQYEIPLQVI